MRDPRTVLKKGREDHPIQALEKSDKPIRSEAGRKDRGFIQLIVIIIISLIVLRFAGISITEILNKPLITEFFSYIKDVLKLVWEDLLTIFKYFKAA